MAVHCDHSPQLKTSQTSTASIPNRSIREFGVVEIDPSDHAYSILVDSAVAFGMAGWERRNVEGPYSNPEIAPFSFRGR